MLLSSSKLLPHLLRNVGTRKEVIALKVANGLMDDPDGFGIRHRTLASLVGWQIRAGGTCWIFTGSRIAAPFAPQPQSAEVGRAGGPADPTTFVDVGLGGGEDLNLRAQKAHGWREVGGIEGGWGGGQEAHSLRRFGSGSGM